MFNNNSRTKNAIFASFASVGNQAAKIIINFAYRTIFLSILSKEFLGVNGLFSNIIQILSLAELGIGTAIIYRMYQAFSKENIEDISALIRFYKNVYRFICLAVCGVSLCLFPFINGLVNVEDIPAGLNINLVYFLFVLQSASSYLFVYKQALLSADQQNHKVTIFATVLEGVSTIGRIIALIITKNYVIVLACGILIQILINYIFSLFITKKYSEVFKRKAVLPKSEKIGIFHDTLGLLCHKVGYIVVTGTSNLILSKWVGLIAVGIYSNYLLIITAIQNLIVNISNSITPIIGNYVISNSKEESYTLYKRFLNLGFWISSFTTICLYVLLNPFITAWLDKSFLFEYEIVAMICFQYYIQTSRLVNNVFVNACGLFMKDKIRPIFEAVINLAVSIILTIKFGIIGIFIGGCVSSILTFYWREPYLLLKNRFNKNGWYYIKINLGWSLLTLALCALFRYICRLLPGGWLFFFIKALICGIGVNAIYILMMRKSDFFEYLFEKITFKFKKLQK